MIRKFAKFCIGNRIWVVTILGFLTLVMAYLGTKVEVKTVFDDLIPKSHPYIETHDQYKETFGGSNLVSIMLEVDEGDIFTIDVLDRIRQISLDLRKVQGVNEFQIISLASKKLKEVTVSGGGINSEPLMWPDIPTDQDGINDLKASVLRNPFVYGAYVSHDLKSALITVDFYDNLVDYEVAYNDITKLVEGFEDDGVSFRIVGEPILFGWVKHYLPETFHIALLAVFILTLILFFFSRTWRGTVLPFLAGLISCIWAMGTAYLIGFHFDPLVVVVAFLITARSISHSVQLVNRFEDEFNHGSKNSKEAAINSMDGLFKPGMLGVIADAGCMLVVILTPIPLLQKMATIGTVWVCTIAISAVILTPVLLSWVQRPKKENYRADINKIVFKVLNGCANIVSGRGRYVVLGVALLVFIISGLYSFNITIGDANPGSPILWPDSTYNQDAKAVNTNFRGSDRMFVVFSGDKMDVLKRPETLEKMAEFQRYMEAQPEIGGSLSIADMLPSMKYILREANPRYYELGTSEGENAELMYLYVAGSDPGDLDRYSDPYYKDGSVTLFFRDHKGETIRTTISRIKEFILDNPMKSLEIKLAGGFVGVLAAINEIILAGQIEAVALGLLVVVICCGFFYRSMGSGILFMVPVIISNTITFSYMAANGIGMNINTVPVAALGIGLGVDYAFYIADGIKEEMADCHDLNKAIRLSLLSAGKGVLITSGSLIFSVFVWSFSSLKFQADMGTMMALWLGVSAMSALLVVPSLVAVFKPEFIVGIENKQIIERSESSKQKPGGREAALEESLELVS